MSRACRVEPPEPVVTHCNCLVGFCDTVDTGRDTFDGGAGSDTANYSAYSAALTVTLNGATAATVTGSGSTTATSDTIVNVENFTGGAGNDTIVGDSNNNSIAGGGGNDTFIATVDTGRDTFDGGAGSDTADYSAYSAALTVTLNGATAATVTGSGFNTRHL